MARKQKCDCQKPGLSAPFFMLTYGDMMTLLLTFFVLLFSMSTIQIIKFQAQIGAIKGSLGISKLYSHAPMQKNLPAPSIKQSPRVVSQSKVKPTTLQPLAEYHRIDLTEPVQKNDNEMIRYIQALGSKDRIQVTIEDEDIVLVLPSFGIFNKGEWQINSKSAEVNRLRSLYADLAKQIVDLTNYDVWFIGHTDALPLKISTNNVIKNNMELGFQRAISIYDYFFKPYLQDKTRITFASQGDNVPIIPDAELDSEFMKNRRVEIHLKKKK
jgi:chemotaxis protein MotB